MFVVFLIIGLILMIIGIISILSTRHNPQRSYIKEIVLFVISCIFFILSLLQGKDNPIHVDDVTTEGALIGNTAIDIPLEIDDTEIDETEEITTETQQSKDDYLSKYPNSILIDGDYFDGNITADDEKDYYVYIAPSTGRYRFDFDISDVNNPFWFDITDSKEEKVSSVSASDGGTTVELKEGETYCITISESSGFLDSYSVKINIPTSVTNIIDNVFGGRIEYKDQIDIYTYTAPKDGIYRFDFDCSNVNNPFYFYLYDSKKDELASLSSSNDGKTIKLIQGETYTINIAEHAGLLDSYTITIGVPTDPVIVNEQYIGGTIKYKDQQDIYYYTAPRKGTYRFDFDSSNVNNSFYFSLFNSKKEELANLSSYNEGKTLHLEKDETYEIHITEYEGLLDSYSVTIGVPKKTKTISSFPVTGELTFKDQCDNYKYTAPYTGEYTFEFSEDNVNCNYDFEVIDSKQERIKNTSSYNEKTTVTLSEGVTYRIHIIQNNGYPVKYKVSLK